MAYNRACRWKQRPTMLGVPGSNEQNMISKIPDPDNKKSYVWDFDTNLEDSTGTPSFDYMSGGVGNHELTNGALKTIQHLFKVPFGYDYSKKFQNREFSLKVRFRSEITSDDQFTVKCDNTNGFQLFILNDHLNFQMWDSLSTQICNIVVLNIYTTFNMIKNITSELVFVYKTRDIKIYADGLFISSHPCDYMSYQ